MFLKWILLSISAHTQWYFILRFSGFRQAKPPTNHLNEAQHYFAQLMEFFSCSQQTYCLSQIPPSPQCWGLNLGSCLRWISAVPTYHWATTGFYSLQEAYTLPSLFDSKKFHNKFSVIFYYFTFNYMCVRLWSPERSDPWNWRSRCVPCPMWMVGTEHRSSAKAEMLSPWAAPQPLWGFSFKNDFKHNF